MTKSDRLNPESCHPVCLLCCVFAPGAISTGGRQCFHWSSWDAKSEGSLKLPGKVNLPGATGCWQERCKHGLNQDQNEGSNLWQGGRVKHWNRSCPHLPGVINSLSCFLLRLYKLQRAGYESFDTSPSRRLWSLLHYFMSITKCSVFSSLQNTRLFKPKRDNLT